MTRPGLPDNLIKKLQNNEDRTTKLENFNKPLIMGTLAERPSASVVGDGFEYFATDVENGATFKTNRGAWIKVSQNAPNFVADTYIQPPNGGWWSGGGNTSIPANTWIGAPNNRLYFPTFAVDTWWQMTLQMLMRSDSTSVWTQQITRIFVYNAASQPQQDFYSYGTSTGAKGFEDWRTYLMEPLPFVIPAGQAGWFADALFFSGGTTSTYNRTYNYNQYKATRVA